tara:strand:+ start:8025 stop:8306 length:282 start_codon:yes stop_codon:yes gene_type:complete
VFDNKKHAPIAVGMADIEREQEQATASATQVGGDHYRNMTIQPAEYNQRNGLNFCEACVIKYVSRHKHKNGAEDVRKAIHFLNLLLEIEYPEA